MTSWLVGPNSTAVKLPTAVPVTGVSGAYTLSWTLSSTSANGGYALYVQVVNNSTSPALNAWGLGSFTVQPAPATAAAQTSQSSTLSSISAALATVSSGVTTANNALSSLTASVNNLNQAATNINGVSAAIANNQTYVLVVAALAAIILVLELAILVRKLS